jgi:hypothetical protein
MGSKILLFSINSQYSKQVSNRNRIPAYKKSVITITGLILSEG